MVKSSSDMVNAIRKPSTIIFLIVLIVLFAVNRISINKEKSAAKGKNY